MRSLRLTSKRSLGVGGEPREGRMVNGVQAQVVPRGTVRSIIADHRRLGNFRDIVPHDDTQVAEVAHRSAKDREVAAPDQPARWGIERAREQLADLLSRAGRNG